MAVGNGRGQTHTPPAPRSYASPPRSLLLDVSALDRYLLTLLLPSHDSDSLLNKNRDWVLPALQLTTILATQGQTPGTKTLGLKLKASQFGLILYALLSSLSPYVYRAVRDWYFSEQSSAMIHNTEARTNTSSAPHSLTNSSNDIQNIGHARKLAAARRLINLVERVGPIVRLGLLLGCWKGLVSTPDPLMVLCGCKVEPGQGSPPKLHVGYAHRRWFYEQGTQTFKTLLGSLAIAGGVWKPCIQSTCQQTMNMIRALNLSPSVEQRSACPCCQRDPPPVPVVGNCGHKYCYACLCQRSANDTSFRCVLCGTTINRALREE